MSVNWTHLEKLYNDVKNYEKPSGHPTGDNPDDIPVVVMDFKKFRGEKETITGKVLLINDNPVVSVGYHYTLSDLMESGRFVCNENTTKFTDTECKGCQLARSASYKPFIDLSFNIYNKSVYESIPQLASLNMEGMNMLRDEAKRMLNMRSKNFFYVLMAIKPYNESLSIIRIMPEDINVFIKAMLDNKEKGSDLFSYSGYDCIMTFNRKNNGFYVLGSVSFAIQKSTLATETDSVKKLKEFMTRFDIYERLKISETSQDEQLKLIKYWFNLQRERLHKEFNIVLDEKKTSFIYNGRSPQNVVTDDHKSDELLESKEEDTTDIGDTDDDLSFMNGVDAIEEDISNMM